MGGFATPCFDHFGHGFTADFFNAFELTFRGITGGERPGSIDGLDKGGRTQFRQNFATELVFLNGLGVVLSGSLEGIRVSDLIR